MDAKDRALQRLIETMTPAAAMGVECPWCYCPPGVRCSETAKPGGVDPHQERINAAREMLTSDLRVLFDR